MLADKWPFRKLQIQGEKDTNGEQLKQYVFINRQKLSGNEKGDFWTLQNTFVTDKNIYKDVNQNSPRAIHQCSAEGKSDITEKHRQDKHSVI